jgi:hypothetical protein
MTRQVVQNFLAPVLINIIWVFREMYPYGLKKQPATDVKEVPVEEVQLDGCSSKKKTIPITKPIITK